MLFKMPYGIHTWAQADRLSLAINFYDNGMNFFLPATHNQYPVRGITGVEFPIQSFLAAAVGKVAGRSHISFAFRLLDLLTGCMGLLALFLATYKRIQDFIGALLPPLFMFSSPVYVYYTCNYLPDAAACSVAFIGFYFILDYLDHPSNKHLIRAITALTLAALIKTSLGLYLFGFIGFVCIYKIRRNELFTRSSIRFLIACCASTAFLSFYYFYNQYLNATYHSTVFLAKPLPFESWEQVIYFFNERIKKLWLQEYLSLPQYLLLPVLFGAAFPILRNQSNGKQQLYLLLIFLSGIMVVGSLLGGALLDHDYYVVSIFLPFFGFSILIAVISLYQAIQTKGGIQSFRIAAVISILLLFFVADWQLHQRLKPGYIGIGPQRPWMEGGAILLDELNISKSERIMAFDDESPNVGLLYCDRKGYSWPYYQNGQMANVIRIMRRLRVHIMVAETTFADKIHSNDSLMKQSFDRIGSRDLITVYRLK